MTFKIGDRVRIDCRYLFGEIGKIIKYRHGQYGLQMEEDSFGPLYFHESELSLHEESQMESKFKPGDRVKSDCGMQGIINSICSGNAYVYFDCGLRAHWNADKLSLVDRSKFKEGEKVYIEGEVNLLMDRDKRGQYGLEFRDSNGLHYLIFDESQILKKEDIK